MILELIECKVSLVIHNKLETIGQFVPRPLVHSRNPTGISPARPNTSDAVKPTTAVKFIVTEIEPLVNLGGLVKVDSKALGNTLEFSGERRVSESSEIATDRAVAISG